MAKLDTLPDEFATGFAVADTPPTSFAYRGDPNIFKAKTRYFTD